MPEVIFQNNGIMPESREELRRFYGDIAKGLPSGQAKLHFCNLHGNGNRWLDTRFVTIFDPQGKPEAALISYLDMTDMHRKELVYERYQAAAEMDAMDSVGVMEANLTLNVMEHYDGALFDMDSQASQWNYDEALDYVIALRFNGEDQK